VANGNITLCEALSRKIARLAVLQAALRLFPQNKVTI